MSHERPQPGGLATAKRRLRAELRAALRGLDGALVAAAGEAVVDHWEAEPALAAARRVLLYAALPGELATRPLFERLRGRGCEMLLPRCGEARLVFARVDDWAELVPGRYGVLEPPPAAPERAIQPADPVLVPGLAFDASGNRLGRGQGWYDRTFGADERARLIGAGFALQVVATVPSDSWDCGVGAILTEAGFTRVTRAP